MLITFPSVITFVTLRSVHGALLTCCGTVFTGHCSVRRVMVLGDALLILMLSDAHDYALLFVGADARCYR